MIFVSIISEAAIPHTGRFPYFRQIRIVDIVAMVLSIFAWFMSLQTEFSRFILLYCIKLFYLAVSICRGIYSSEMTN